MLVDDQRTLKDLCEQAMQCSYCAIDTEFVWRKTYLPRIGLIQVAVPGGRCFAVDPPAISDVEPLRRLLRCPHTLKVFHACSQDLEVLCQYCDTLPTPLFDTQIAAAFCNMGFQISYAALVENCLCVTVDKRQQASDWCRRPLTKEQISYALNEVSYLLDSYEVQARDLQQRNRYEWVIAQCEQILAAFQQARADGEPGFRNVKGHGKLSSRQLTILDNLVRWRESRAREVDLPTGWVVEDRSMIEIARSEPRTLAELQDAGIVDQPTFRRYAQTLVDHVNEGLTLPSAELIKKPVNRPPTPKQKRLIQAIVEDIATAAKDHGVAAELIATRQDVTAFVLGKLPTLFADGWRQELELPTNRWC